MIPLTAQLTAPPGYVLLERLEQPLVRGSIILPPGVRTKTRSSEAIVLDVGAGVLDYQPGDRVLLSTTVSRSIFVGERGERRIYRAAASQILARVAGEGGVVNHGEPVVGLPQWRCREQLALDEGTPEALK